jgi:hypothetical protein
MGTANPNYKHGMGMSIYPRAFYKARPKIIQRDGGCVICGTKLNLCVHHKDCNPKNNKHENLITVCATHHIIHHKSSQTPYPQLLSSTQTSK